MVRDLKCRNKLGFVDKTYTKPTQDDVKILMWECVNDVVCSWILGSNVESMYGNHTCSEITSEIWSKLYDTYPKADG